MAAVLPSDIVTRVLNPIIKTGDFPMNQAAVKMMTKVADHGENREFILANLHDIMPGLIKVRKEGKQRFLLLLSLKSELLNHSQTAGVRQRRVLDAQGVRLLHRVPPPARGRGLAAAPREPHRLQVEAAEPVHQARAGAEGAERARQSQAIHSAVMRLRDENEEQEEEKVNNGDDESIDCD